jgi:hypothetical protein
MSPGKLYKVNERVSVSLADKHPDGLGVGAEDEERGPAGDAQLCPPLCQCVVDDRVGNVVPLQRVRDVVKDALVVKLGAVHAHHEHGAVVKSGKVEMENGMFSLA